MGCFCCKDWQTEAADTCTKYLWIDEESGREQRFKFEWKNEKEEDTIGTTLRLSIHYDITEIYYLNKNDETPEVFKGTKTDMKVEVNFDTWTIKLNNQRQTVSFRPDVKYDEQKLKELKTKNKLFLDKLKKYNDSQEWEVKSYNAYDKYAIFKVKRPFKDIFIDKNNDKNDHPENRRYVYPKKDDSGLYEYIDVFEKIELDLDKATITYTSKNTIDPFSDEKLQKLADEFCEIDTDNSNSLKLYFKEFQPMMKSLGMPEDQYVNCWKAIDTDTNGYVDWNEFVKFHSSGVAYVSADQLSYVPKVGDGIEIIAPFLTDDNTEFELKAGDILDVKGVDEVGDIAVSSKIDAWESNKKIKKRHFIKIKLVREKVSFAFTGKYTGVFKVPSEVEENPVFVDFDKLEWKDDDDDEPEPITIDYFDGSEIQFGDLEMKFDGKIQDNVITGEIILDDGARGGSFSISYVDPSAPEKPKRRGRGRGRGRRGKRKGRGRNGGRQREQKSPIGNEGKRGRREGRRGQGQQNQKQQRENQQEEGNGRQQKKQPQEEQQREKQEREKQQQEKQQRENQQQREKQEKEKQQQREKQKREKQQQREKQERENQQQQEKQQRENQQTQKKKQGGKGEGRGRGRGGGRRGGRGRGRGEGRRGKRGKGRRNE